MLTLLVIVVSTLFWQYRSNGFFLQNPAHTVSHSAFENEAAALRYWRRVLHLDYEFSETANFTNKNIVKGENWTQGIGINFDKNDKARHHDLQFDLNSKGQLYFHHLDVNEMVSHYDAGEVPFESVTVADSEHFPNGNTTTPCTVNHVYVVRTWEGKYAKFIVREIEVMRYPLK